MFRTLARILTGSRPPSTDPEALVDALLLVLYADRVIKLEEQEKLEQTFAEIPWTSGVALPYYASQATAKVRAALGDDAKVDNLIVSIAERTTSAESRQKLLEACEALAASDGETSPGEGAIINKLRAKLS